MAEKMKLPAAEAVGRQACDDALRGEEGIRKRGKPRDSKPLRFAKKKVGFALCGSFCNFEQVLPVVETLVARGYDVIPIMSEFAYATDTRFGKAEEFITCLEGDTGNKVLHTIAEVEPFGPKALLDILIIAPCTGNTVSKLALGITDTSVTMAAKAHLRNENPVLIAVASNDALSGTAKNIGQLLSGRNIFFVPMEQDDPQTKPRSLVAKFERIPECVAAALEGRQVQPVYL